MPMTDRFIVDGLLRQLETWERELRGIAANADDATQLQLRHLFANIQANREAILRHRLKTPGPLCGPAE